MVKPHIRPDLVPNLDFGSPVIFFDSHPEQQESHLYSYYSSLKSQLVTAWTGVVVSPLQPGKLRIVWWTTDRIQGIKDYELHEHRLVKANFDSLRDLPDVRRVLVTGFSGQNPYAIEQESIAGTGAGAGNLFESGMDRKVREEKENMRRWAERGQEGILEERGMVDVEDVIRRNEEAEKQRLLQGREGQVEEV